MMELDADSLRPLLKYRVNDTHKGSYGHLLIVAGSAHMPGAALLATAASLRSGCGLVTLHSSRSTCMAAVQVCSSAMLSFDTGDCFSTLPASLDRYGVIAVGPGLGRDPRTAAALEKMLLAAREAGKPMLLDADALNLISADRRLFDLIPPSSVLTPHPGELRRLAGGPYDDGIITGICRRTFSVLVAKGWHTRIYTSEGCEYVNLSGNPGMAKGGSGDVLAGLVGGLMARGYAAVEAAALGVWLHGRAGDMLSARCTTEAYSSRDLVDALPEAFRELYSI